MHNVHSQSSGYGDSGKMPTVCSHTVISRDATAFQQMREGTMTNRLGISILDQRRFLVS